MENYKNSKIGQETAQKYGDIIEMERPQTEESLRKHPRMTLQNRAKIFSPFAALRGYDEQLAAEKQRTERVTKRILTEEEMSPLPDVKLGNPAPVNSPIGAFVIILDLVLHSVAFTFYPHSCFLLW